MLRVVLGSKTVATKMSRILITHGLRAQRLAKVSSWAVDCRMQHTCRRHVCFSVLFEVRCLYTNNDVYIPPITGTMTTTIRPVPVCPKCSLFRNAGKLSCCAPGATWFKKCGNSNDPKVDHTWLEGFQSCEGTELCSIYRVNISLSLLC